MIAHHPYHMSQVLPLYIVVMLAHGTTEPVVVENLEAFLGEHSQAFTTWWAMIANAISMPADVPAVDRLLHGLQQRCCMSPSRLFQHMGEASKVEALKIASNAGVAPSSAAAATSVAPAAGHAPTAAAAAAAAGNTAQQASPASLATLKAAQAAPRCHDFLASMMRTMVAYLVSFTNTDFAVPHIALL